MRLYLISPKWPENSLWGQIVFRFPYLALTTLAALTGDDWEVEIKDENVEPINFSDPPDMAAISFMTPLAKRAYEIAETYRRQGVCVVLGGIHPTMMQDEAKDHADAVVIGEGEEVWPEVLEDFSRRRLKPFYGPSGYQNLDRFPSPKRELLDRKAYFFINTLQTTRGCPFDCEFCSVTSFYGRSYRVRSVEKIIDELTHMEGGFLFFVDDNIVGKPDFAKELFRALIPLRLKWFSQASLSMIKDRELLDLAQKSGCRGLFIGFESLSQDMLKKMGKSVNLVEEYHDAVKMIHDHGIGIQGSFIFGTDGDGPSVFSDVLRFIEKTHLEAALFSILTPFPGTRIYNVLSSQGRILHHDWEKYDMNHVVFQPRTMSIQQLQEGFNSAYRHLYSYGSITKRLFPFKRNLLFYAIQNYGFRQAWKKTLRSNPI